MTIRESKKVSARRILALIISVAAHAALAYYLITAAIKYALPEGEAPAEISFESPETAVDATDVEVVETTTPITTMPAVEPATPTPVPKPVAPPKPAPKVEAPPIEPAKEASVEDVPVPAAINEEPPEVEDVPSEEPQEETPAVAAVPVVAPVVAPPVEAPPAPPAPTPPTPPTPTATESIGGGGIAPVQSDSVLIPLATNRAPPYPELALRKKLEGVTTVHYTVSAAGDVIDIKVVESSGHAILDNQIVSTIKTWKFKPPGRVGIYERPIRYRLTGEERAAPSRLRRGSP